MQNVGFLMTRLKYIFLGLMNSILKSRISGVGVKFINGSLCFVNFTSDLEKKSCEKDLHLV